MAEHHVYKKTEIVGTGDSIEDAVDNGIERAGETIRNLRWFEVDEIRGSVVDGAIEYQVTLKVGFTLDA